MLAARAMVRDQSVGTVAVGDGWRAKIRYSLANEDRLVAISAMRWLSRLYFAAGAKEVLPGRRGIPFLRTEAEALAALPDDLPTRDFLQLYASHPMGTCRMHPDAAHGVVNVDGAVHGTSNLYVMDASVFPSALGVNPQMTVMAMALHLAERLATA
jgi:choline dehydrogenase-like flavoprotein